MNTPQKYQKALDQLEAGLLTPMVSGELIVWIDGVSQSADVVSAMFWRETEGVHEADYSQMIQEDPELSARVEKLKLADRECLERLETLLDQIVNLKKMAQVCEPDEAGLTTHVEALIQTGLAWVIDAKRQERACETWLIEAAYRDRGVGD